MTRVKGRVGDTYGRLTVIRQEPSQKGYAMWFCQCDCGATGVYRGGNLASGTTQSCGCIAAEACLQGERFGRWQVIEKVGYKWLCRCSCGEEALVSASKLKAGISRSCGCLQKELAKGRHTKHGHHNHPLYPQWRGMFQRSQERLQAGDQCFVHPDWSFEEDGGFESFVGFCMSNGWEKGMHICRNGDCGNYSPSNTRVDTATSNAVEANAQWWELVDPDGNPVNVYNLKQFCRDNGLQQPLMWAVCQGKRNHHKGWTAQRKKA